MPKTKAPKKAAMKKTAKKSASAKSKATRPARDIGLGIEPPKDSCDDVDCPYHGSLPVRGQMIIGKVLTDRMDKTVIVRKDYSHYIEKYERLEKRRNSYAAHNPPCIDAQAGDIVKIIECRPLAKSKSFVVVQKIEG